MKLQRPGHAKSDRLADLVERAIGALRHIRQEATDGENRAWLVEAATALESLAKRLRGDLSGRDLVLELLKAAHPKSVPAAALRTASGIQEFARRIRELRVQYGYDIETTPDGYRLVALEPDTKAAARWILMNEIRRRPGSARDRIRAMFEASIGVVVTIEDVEYVGKISSAARRVRELRTEHGLRIESHKDNPTLHPGQYVLVDLEPIPAVERSVDVAQRERILRRDAYRCRQCGRGPDTHKRIWLEVDHVQPVSEGGSNRDENLRTLCNLCHTARGHAAHAES